MRSSSACVPTAAMPAAVQHDDAVGDFQRVQAVRDEERRPADRTRQRLVDAAPRSPRRPGLVNSSRIRMLGLRRIARASAIRCFCRRTACGPLADARLVAAGQFDDEVVGEGLRAASSTSSALRPRDAVGDVVVNRVVEQERLLRHHADLLPQAPQVHLAQVVAVDQDRCRGRGRRSAAAGSAASSCRSRSCRPAATVSPARTLEVDAATGSAGPARRRSRRRGTR